MELVQLLTSPSGCPSELSSQNIQGEIMAVRKEVFGKFHKERHSSPQKAPVTAISAVIPLRRIEPRSIVVVLIPMGLDIPGQFTPRRFSLQRLPEHSSRAGEQQPVAFLAGFMPIIPKVQSFQQVIVQNAVGRQNLLGRAVKDNSQRQCLRCFLKCKLILLFDMVLVEADGRAEILFRAPQ